jgi:phage tail protein X
LLLALLFVMARVYLATSSSDHAQQTITVPDAHKEISAVTEPSHAVSEQPVLASPAVSQPDREDAPPAATSAHQDARTVVLKEEGGSLYFIALKHYGKANETIYDLILQANPAIVDVRKIDDRQKIAVPRITAESYIKGGVQDGYRIHVGTYETAQWADIYAASVKRTGIDVFIEPRHVSAQDTWYRLMIGDFNHKEEALQTVRALAKKGMIYLPSPPG